MLQPEKGALPIFGLGTYVSARIWYVYHTPTDITLQSAKLFAPDASFVVYFLSLHWLRHARIVSLSNEWIAIATKCILDAFISSRLAKSIVISAIFHKYIHRNVFCSKGHSLILLFILNKIVLFQDHVCTDCLLYVYIYIYFLYKQCSYVNYFELDTQKKITKL